MSVSEDLIDFDIIENQKENIQSLPQGRSARNLAKLFSPSPLQPHSTPTPSDTKNLNDAIREEYETELMTIAESDDPLDIYDRYVKWTFDAYPTAQATPASQLAPLLERATKSFLNSPQYKNDPRYLKLWLSYIRFFADSPRETFAFLARHNIGEGLALYYEEFAAWLENAGRWVQAEEVYQLGIDKEARPAPRLLRKFNEFKERFAARPDNSNEPSSPALPTVRPALAAKIDPYAAAAAPRDPQAPRPPAGVGGPSTTKSGKQKMKIFADDANSPAPAVTSSPGAGWQSIGSLAERKKENMMEPKPWVGETLKAGGKKSSTKIPIFKDESLPLPLPPIAVPELQQVTINPKNGRSERIFVNLEAVYPTPERPGTELSFEELRAAYRGWLSKVWEKELQEQKQSHDFEPCEPAEEPKISSGTVTRTIPVKLDISRDPVLVDENGMKKEHHKEGKQRRMKVKEVNETQIIKAKLSSPSGPKMKKRKPREATMTLHTKAATDEIYDIFNQPLKTGEEEEEEEEDEEESDDDYGDMTDGDYTSGGESTNTTGRFAGNSEAEDDDDETSDAKSVSEWSEFTAKKDAPDQHEDEASTYTEGEDEEFEEIKVEVPRSMQQNEEVVTPISPEAPSTTRTSFVPIPPEDYDPPTHPYRDPCQVSQNRLPFMTPIVERTESSLGLPTVREAKDYFHSDSPSKASGSKIQVFQDDLGSSPLKEMENEVRPTDRFPQPQLGKRKTGAPLSTKEVAPKGPIIQDSQCNPVDEEIRQLIFANLQPPLSTYEGFSQHDEKRGRAAEIKKYAKAITKTSKSTNEKTNTNISMSPVLQFPGTDRQYTLKRELGAGAFAPVYLLESFTEDEQDENQAAAVMGKGAFDHFNRKPLEALKMEDPPSAWEFYIMRQAKRRLGVSRPAESIIDVYEMHLYKDECYLIEEYRDQGTLLDIINICRADAKSPGGVMDELLVMFFTIELFRTVEALHSKGILHGDLKADNCLVRFDTVEDDEVWSPKYRKDGSGCWNMKGITLIDFGRGIDMKAFKPDVQFIADWKTGPQDCAEMRELRPWTYQIDYHGLAGIIHSMLFGKYIDTVAERGGEGLGGVGGGGLRKWRIKEGLKRYWQTEIWSGVFDLLLNPGGYVDGEEGGKMPVVRGMRVMREEMENWLESNCEKGSGLMKGIRKLEDTIKGKRK
ncbi:putative mitotic checkpoint serine threonine kinase protein [Rutstroemia sp. NJR-2017a WRK4]|nr:putative mitotic checkpoint serine threonine kinase protein [Rutstroemia sp. NJR-2017a WRK4]